MHHIIGCYTFTICWLYIIWSCILHGNTVYCPFWMPCWKLKWECLLFSNRSYFVACPFSISAYSDCLLKSLPVITSGPTENDKSYMPTWTRAWGYKMSDRTRESKHLISLTTAHKAELHQEREATTWSHAGLNFLSSQSFRYVRRRCAHLAFVSNLSVYSSWCLGGEYILYHIQALVV